MLAGAALLLVAVLALGAAAWRAAGRLTAEPLERALAAAPLGACAAALEALLLGRLDLGDEPLALAGAAVLTFLVARLALPATTGEALRLGRGAQVIGGAIAAVAVWLLMTPALGVDGISYHLPEVLAWTAGGDTGSTPVVVAEFQTGSYPLTNEVLLAWAMGISRSFAPMALWTGAALSLLLLGGWVGLRRMGVGAGVSVLALAALLAEPLLVGQLNTPKSDLPALAWLVACAGLCACAVRGRAVLLGPAVVAAGLAVGSKTTTVPLAVIVLAASLWACRHELRVVRTALAWGALAAGLVGAVWYLRNQFAHGWLLWPFGDGPLGGDPEPAYLSRIHVSFMDRPRFTLEGRTDDYLKVIGGGLVLIAGGIGSALLARRRLVLGAAAATAVAMLAWLVAPFTGRADNPILDLSLTTTRYLLPVFAAGAAALALAGRTSVVARGVLVVALVWNLVRTIALERPDVPPVWVLLAGVAAGAAFALLRPRRAAWALAAVATVVVAAAGADGWLERSARATRFDTAPLQAFFADQPGWADSREPVAFVSNMVAPLAGDRLRHPLALIPGDEPCATTLHRAQEGWVVLRDAPAQFRALLAPVRAPECLEGLTPVAHPGNWIVYRQIATTSSAASRSSGPSRKSPTPIAASSGV